MTLTDTTSSTRPNAFWMIALGILMIALGIIGIGMAYYLTIAAVIWFGVLAIIAGVAQLFDVVHHKGWKAIVWHVLIALLYIAAGVVMMLLPIRSAFILTLLIAFSLIAAGVLRLIMAFGTRGLGTGATMWLVLSAVLSIALGLLLYGTVTPPGPEALATPEGQMEWVRTWGWIIGLFVSLELISQGVALLSLGVLARSAGASSGTGTAGTARA